VRTISLQTDRILTKSRNLNTKDTANTGVVLPNLDIYL